MLEPLLSRIPLLRQRSPLLGYRSRHQRLAGLPRRRRFFSPQVGHPSPPFPRVPANRGSLPVVHPRLALSSLLLRRLVDPTLLLWVGVPWAVVHKGPLPMGLHPALLVPFPNRLVLRRHLQVVSRSHVGHV